MAEEINVKEGNFNRQVQKDGNLPWLHFYKDFEQCFDHFFELNIL